MVLDPLAVAKTLAQLQPAEFYFHIEVTKNQTEIIKKLRDLFPFVGIGLSPTTGIESLPPLLHLIDGIVLLGVQPGKSGQHYLENTTERAKLILDALKKMQSSCSLTIDGGIKKKELHELTKMGCDRFVLGSALFSKKNPATALKNLLNGL
jgi:ribulose-phosphate 3-epimerase